MIMNFWWTISSGKFKGTNDFISITENLKKVTNLLDEKFLFYELYVFSVHSQRSLLNNEKWREVQKLASNTIHYKPGGSHLATKNLLLKYLEEGLVK